MTKIDVYFDGACGPINPGGITSCGVVIKIDGEIVEKMSHRFYPPDGMTTTNNVAEYAALKSAFDYLIHNELYANGIIVHGDSNLVIQQMSGKWGIKSGDYKPIAIECLTMLWRFANIQFKWIPREENTLADELSKKAQNLK